MTALVATPGAATSADDGLVVTAWMAQATLGRLRTAGLAVVPLNDPAVTRSTFEDALVDVSGLVIAAHGDDFGVYDAQRQPLLDGANVHLLAEKWCHALACRTGVELALLAVDAGALCYVGYEAKLNVEWDPHSLPGGGATVLADLVSETSLRLAQGDFDQQSLRTAADSQAQALFGWLNENLEQLTLLERMALFSLGEQLGRKFCVRTPADDTEQESP